MPRSSLPSDGQGFPVLRFPDGCGTGICAGMENSLLSKEQAAFLSGAIVFFLRYCVDLDEEIIEALKYKK